MPKAEVTKLPIAEVIASPQMPANVPVVDGLVAMIERVARDPSVDIVRLQQLLEMHERITSRNALLAFNEAMSAAQSEMRQVGKDASNPQTRSRFASYGALDEAIRSIYTDHGFAMTFDTGEGAPEQHVRVLCDVSHKGGHTRPYHVDMPADGKGAKGGDVMTRTHATGSAITYGRRYLLQMIFNIATGDAASKAADDDGNAAGGGYITPPQLKAIIDLCDDVGADKARFCKYFRIQGLAQLPASRFQAAIAALEAKRRKNG